MMIDERGSSGGHGHAQRPGLAAALGILGLWAGAEGGAAEGSASDVPAGLTEIVVTAQRREQDLQAVPVAVSVVDQRAIETFRVADSLAIGERVPNVEIKTFVGVPNVFIRGVGNNDFNAVSISPVTLYRDEVPLASTASQAFALFDTKGVEVLRGPQGTLFGKNTIGGAILYSSRPPAEYLEGYGRIGYGRFDLMEAEAAASVPLLSDRLALRVAGMIRERGGERTNVFTGRKVNDIDQVGGRTILLYTPSESSAARLTVGLFRDRSDFHHGKPRGIIAGADLFGYRDPFPDDATRLDFNGPSRHYVDDHYASLHWSWKRGQLMFRSITGYDKSDSENFMDVDLGPERLNHNYFYADAWQASQEFQVAYDGERSTILLGVFGLYEELRTATRADMLGALTPLGMALPLAVDAERENTSLALFAQGTRSIGDRLRVTLGGRYSREKTQAAHRSYLAPGYFDADIPDGPQIDLVPFAKLSDTSGAFSGRIAVDYDLTRSLLGYVSATRGFKAGGFNIGAIMAPVERTKVEPEYIDAYEIGVKATLLGRLRLNVSAFHYDYTDLQVLSVNQQAGTTVPTLVLENAADARIDGLELESTLQASTTLALTASVGLLDARYGSYKSAAIDPAGVPRDFSGNRLPGAPRGNGSFDFSWSPELNAAYRVGITGEYRYTSKMYFNSAEDPQISSLAGYGVVNGRVTIGPRGGAWEVSLWGKNLGDKVYVVNSFDQKGFGFVPYYFGERRTFGVELKVSLSGKRQPGG